MRTANQFVNPKTGERYAWPLNHDTEAQVNKSRQMGDGASTANMGLIPQEGPATPLTFQWTGSILEAAQLDAMLHWWNICEGQTIHIIDFAGDEYEALITDFQPTRVRLAANPRQPGKPWKWTYTFTFRVLSVISGPWLGVTP